MGYLQTKKRALMNSVQSGGRLPAEYQEVEYIESHNTEYIDTQFIGNQNTRIIFDYQLTQVPSQTHLARFFANRYSYSSRGIWLCFTFNGELKIGVQYNSTITGVASLYVRDLNRHTIDYNNNLALYIDDDFIINFQPGRFTTPSSIKLLATYDYYNDTLYFGLYAKIYSIKIYNGTTIQRDYVPCYRKSDNEIGLYDLVEGVFYTNQGTGTFTKGADV